MVRDIVTSEFFLRLPCEEASREDLPLAQDLLDTLAAHADECVGLAANMVGERKRVIAFINGKAGNLAMLNPRIVERAGAYATEEGCLSLAGVRPCTRYRRIKVAWLGTDLAEHERTFTGYTAQIIQHEVDHCNSVVI